MKPIRLLLFVGAIVFGLQFSYAQTPEKTMYAHYIDVGQALSVLLEFPGGAVLIDAGAQPDHEVTLVNYLKKFFSRRTDLHNTLNSVFITHQHIDHDAALDDLTRNFKILNYIDNGRRRVTHEEVNQIWMQDHHNDFGAKYEKITYDNIVAMHSTAGYTDNVIDAVTGTVDPQIFVYSGAFEAKPANWSDTVYNDPNNNSIVIKVLFGKASFLFSGDLELEGIKKVLDYYDGTDALKADVMQVGHHGAKNAINARWLTAIRPQYAIISCGKWNYGRKPNGKPVTFTTYAYAHPNKVAIDLLEAKLPNLRQQAHTDTIGVTGSYHGSIPVFTRATMKKVYATPWDGTIVIQATDEGKYTFTLHN